MRGALWEDIEVFCRIRGWYLGMGVDLRDGAAGRGRGGNASCVLVGGEGSKGDAVCLGGGGVDGGEGGG